MNLRHPRHTKRQFLRPQTSGFTFIEIIAVLMVLAVLAVVVGGGVRLQTEVPAEASLLASHLRYAQSRAMADAVPWGIAVTANSYTLQRNCAEALTSLPGEDSAVRLLTSDVVLSPATVTFAPGRGVPIISCDSPDAITENVVITIVAGGAIATVEVTRVTGFVP